MVEPSDSGNGRSLNAHVVGGTVRWLETSDEKRIKPTVRRGRGSNLQSKILLTGATGYVGGRLLPLLLKEGHQVRCLSRRASSQPDFDSSDVEFAVGSASVTPAARSQRATSEYLALLLTSKTTARIQHQLLQSWSTLHPSHLAEV